MIPGMPLGTQLAAWVCRFSPRALPASNASTIALASGVSLGGVAVVREPAPTPGDHTPLQSGHLATLSYAVARGISCAPDGPETASTAAPHPSSAALIVTERISTPQKPTLLQLATRIYGRNNAGKPHQPLERLADPDIDPMVVLADREVDPQLHVVGLERPVTHTDAARR